ncbi:hypothetical protein K438DRAFT_1786987 [Mycena galopus ATCC 62051]|nr:hypothetical protein K438DRAFT_1786987 [Mycena galopus ATCC 62051]
MSPHSRYKFSCGPLSPASSILLSSINADMHKRIALLLQQAQSADADCLYSLFRHCDSRELFLVSTESHRLWTVCVKILRDCEPVVNTSWKRSTRLPMELKLLVLGYLDIRDLSSLTLTRRNYHWLCSRYIEQVMNGCLSRFRLQLDSLRFMLVHTDALTVSGYFACSMLMLKNMHFYGTRQIDIFVCGKDNSIGVEKYLAASAGYYRTKVNTQPAYHGHHQSTHLQREGHAANCIVVHCGSRNPRADVFTQALTCLHNWISGEGFFAAYPDLTLTRRALISHTWVWMNGNTCDLKSIAAVGENAERNGFSLMPYHASLTSGPICSLLLTFMWIFVKWLMRQI